MPGIYLFSLQAGLKIVVHFPPPESYFQYGFLLVLLFLYGLFVLVFVCSFGRREERALCVRIATDLPFVGSPFCAL